MNINGIFSELLTNIFILLKEIYPINLKAYTSKCE